MPPRLEFAAASEIANRILQMFEASEFDVCTIFYAQFKSAMTQVVTAQQLIPFAPSDEEEGGEAAGFGQSAS